MYSRSAAANARAAALEGAGVPAVDRVQPFLAGEKSLNGVKSRRIAAVDRHPFIPIAQVGGAEFVTAHRSDLIP